MITEAQRHRLYIALEGQLGEEAGTLMDLLPASGWADVATKQDLEALRAATKSDLEAHRAATNSDLDAHRAATRSDLDAHRAATRSDLEALRAATKADLAVLATKDEVRDSQRTIIFSMLAAMATHTGLLITVITLLR